MEWKNRFYFIVYLLSTPPILGLSTTVNDPCAGYLSKHEKNKAVTMCEDGYAKEETPDANHNLDSVVLRVMKHQENCTCNVSFIEQDKNISIYAKPYGGYSNVVPQNSNCGLVIDIYGTTNRIDLIECNSLEGTKRHLAILQSGEELELRSRLTDGSFTQGYCLQFYRVYHSSNDFDLQITCFKPEISTDPLPHEYTVSSTESSKGTKSQDTTISTVLDNQSSPPNTTKCSNICNVTDYYIVDAIKDSGEHFSVYIIAGSSAGGVLVLLFVIIVAMRMCRKHRKKEGSEAVASSVNDNINQGDKEYDSYGLKDNVLYVSSDEQLDTDNINNSSNRKISSAYVGNYSTVDVDESINQDDGVTGDYSTVDLEENNERQYYNVTLQKPKFVLKPVSQKEQPTIKVEYAAVNKTIRNGDKIQHFSVEGTGDEYAMVHKQ